MSSLTQERNTPQYGVDVIPQLTNYPVAGGVIVYQGSIAVLTEGVATKGQPGAGFIALGRVEATVDNTTGAKGALRVPIRQGVFRWGNSTGADAISPNDVGSDCFIVDDQTLAKTNGGAARSRAGKVVLVDPDGGVWVQIGIGL